METVNKGNVGSVNNKLTLEQIKTEYHQNDICMFDLLASLPAKGLTMEEAFELYIEAKKWADGDEFYKVMDDEEPEKL